MASDSSSRPSLSPLPAIAAGVRGFATCPSCHTIDAIVTNVAVNGGADAEHEPRRRSEPERRR
jgi:hypothetical protein